MTKPRVRRRALDLLQLAVGLGLPVPWIVVHALGAKAAVAPEVATGFAGLAILGGATAMTWATELAERDVPQALALVLLALLSVLPEYAVDLHFAWRAGQNPAYAAYAVANMTGGNRLLIGLGWAAVAWVAVRRQGGTALRVDPSQRLEIRFLLWSTLYAFLIPLDGKINLFDGALLVGLFVLYVRCAVRAEVHDVELVGPSAFLDRSLSTAGRRLCTAALFLFAGYTIFVSAAPFAEGLLEVGRRYGLNEFLLVQWVAPIASEAPEFLAALMLAWKRRGSLGLGALVSSKVNQWTLLVGTIPVAFALSAGRATGLPLDARQTEELLLTAAQSLFATVLVLELRFSRRDALLVAALFLAQLVLPGTGVRYGFTGLYVVLSLAFLMRGGRTRMRALGAALWPIARREAPGG